MKNKIKSILSFIRHSRKYVSDSRNAGDKRSKSVIIRDMILLYIKYGITVSEYLQYGIGTKMGEERVKIVNVLRNKHRWDSDYNDNWRFLEKYTKLKWQKTRNKRKKRDNAYIKRYNMGEKCKIQNGVTFIAEHHSIGKIKIGNRCLFARNCDIDITGDIEIGDGVGVLEGAKILTHAHDSYHFMKDSDLIPFSNRAYKTNLKIGNNVSINVHAVILPGVREIGEGSIIQAGAVVDRPVPPHVIVAGNPAKVVRKIPTVVHRTKQ